MTTAADIINSALRRVSVLAAGEPTDPNDAQDCLDAFNELRASQSTDKDSVFGVQENILQWVAGQRQYKIGNPLCTDLGEPPFSGTLTGASNVITGVTSIPTDLAIGATLTDFGAVIPAGTMVTAIGANTVTMSQPASSTYPGLDLITYSIPGDFAIQRPLYITSGYTRINQLDFTLNVFETEQRYNEILYKFQPGPWPLVGWYNNTYPYGLLTVYQSPSASVEFHLFTKALLGSLTLSQTVIEPPGYIRAWKWLLTREIWPEYHGTTPFPQHMAKLADEALKTIQALNAKPAPVARYDAILSRGNRPDGGYILHGGYR